MNNPKYKIRRPKYGVGINDADYSTSKCPYYWKWNGIMYRCYSPSYKITRPSYIGVTMCDEWLTFSNFRAWCIEQEKEVGDISKLDLDKDLLGDGAKIYSPSTCCFLPKIVNLFLENTSRGQGLMGVTKHRGKFRTSVRDSLRNKRNHMSGFTTEFQAFRAYIMRKIELAREMAFSTNLVPQAHVKHALVMFYPDVYRNVTFHK